MQGNRHRKRPRSSRSSSPPLPLPSLPLPSQSLPPPHLHSRIPSPIPSTKQAHPSEPSGCSAFMSTPLCPRVPHVASLRVVPRAHWCRCPSGGLVTRRTACSLPFREDRWRQRLRCPSVGNAACLWKDCAGGEEDRPCPAHATRSYE